MFKRAYILCGLPGSGKSTFANDLPKNYGKPNICSTDNFHIVNGVYKFKRKNRGPAHQKCFRQFIEGCRDGNTLMVCDNTNTTIKEIWPYYTVAKAFEYDVEIVRFLISPELSIVRNIHNVPENTIKKMYARLEQTWEDLPKGWVKRELIRDQIQEDKNYPCSCPEICRRHPSAYEINKLSKNRYEDGFNRKAEDNRDD